MSSLSRTPLRYCECITRSVSGEGSSLERLDQLSRAQRQPADDKGRIHKRGKKWLADPEGKVSS